MSGDPRLARLSLNQATVKRASVAEAVDGCARHGIPAIGLWREPVAEAGLERTRKLVADAGLRVSSLCRGGFLTAADPAGRAAALADNRRAIDEAAELGAACLVLVVGGLPDGDRDLVATRGRMAEVITELADYAAQRRVRLALEPMHPVFCADRGVLSTLAQALDVAEPLAADAVGVVVDALHVWWDPDLDRQVARAGQRIASYQVCDWITPLPADVLLGRGLPGDGHVDFDRLGRLVSAAGYTGDVEVEVFNAEIWAADPDEVLAEMVRRYLTLVLPSLT
ncbi:sugar phosphate isomerase/epimerase family protein [Goodfellowiella coeruleoviolacea]|uniref:Sugar phosphate isomerase/epimerase n=1 Tax=Goodfellowiella coeruleoviolacea TaxID=334858 RepID=A0AAE3KEE6_9PSEU|nr:sugar phosphate isomerase/epimerase family protein [Goodfellowiella coeruleoviolacea]MCP2163822.1 Sugar phosphate isomerase/epimerase [Goodfellowiella coeruleoviolacea]